MSDQLVFLLSVLAFLVLLWLVLGFQHVRHVRQVTLVKWRDVQDNLAKRQSMVPLLIEILRKNNVGGAALIDNLIKTRILAAKEYESTAKKVEYEMELTQLLNEIFGWKEVDLQKDTMFLGVRKDIDDNEEQIETASKKYNDAVRRYNKQITLFWLLPFVKLLGYGAMNIFEFEE